MTTNSGTGTMGSTDVIMEIAPRWLPTQGRTREGYEFMERLHRMYRTWAELHGCEVVSATEEGHLSDPDASKFRLVLRGDAASRLCAEGGQHRLVEASKFDAEHRRTSSVAMVIVSPAVVPARTSSRHDGGWRRTYVFDPYRKVLDNHAPSGMLPDPEVVLSGQLDETLASPSAAPRPRGGSASAVRTSFRWTLEVDVDEQWVADGFDLTREATREAMINAVLGSAHPLERSIRLVDGPADEDVARAQGFKSVEAYRDARPSSDQQQGEIRRCGDVRFVLMTIIDGVPWYANRFDGRSQQVDDATAWWPTREEAQEAKYRLFPGSPHVSVVVHITASLPHGATVSEIPIDCETCGEFHPGDVLEKTGGACPRASAPKSP